MLMVVTFPNVGLVRSMLRRARYGVVIRCPRRRGLVLSYRASEQVPAWLHSAGYAVTE